MNDDRLLAGASLAAALLFSLHVTGDMVYGLDRIGVQNMGLVAILVVWLFGVRHVDRGWGRALLLVGGAFAAAMPYLHLQGPRIAAIVPGPGGFWFYWVLMALGTAGAVAFLLAVHGLWRSFRARPH